MKNILITVLFISTQLAPAAQERFFVRFTDKDGQELDPYAYFDQKAMDRRIKHGIPLVEYTDLPVRADYVERVSALSRETGHQSRWLNGIFITAGNWEISLIRMLPFVREVHEIRTQGQIAGKESENEILGLDENLVLRGQTMHLGGNIFADSALDGSGVRIAIFDTGFPNAPIIDELKHVFDNNRVIKTKNFIKSTEQVYSYYHHGTMVLSCIAGIHDSIPMGLAPNAEFLLAVTEHSLPRETFKEEEAWLAAVEWADQNGADIINSSLGYTFHRYFPWQMDGQTSLVSRAANIAAHKGILIVNAMGNSGNVRWQVMASPADADSALSVGGINPFSLNHIYFSSYGPTADYRQKPNVCAYGRALVATEYQETTLADGTSFASPLVTGFAACVMQYRPELTNMEVFRLIERSAHLYPYYDYAHGYGIPQASYIMQSGNKADKSFAFQRLGDIYFITFDITAIQKAHTDSVRIGYLDILYPFDDKMFPNEEVEHDAYLLYHVENPRGYLDAYRIIGINKMDTVYLPDEECRDGHIIRAWFLGYTDSLRFE